MIDTLIYRLNKASETMARICDTVSFALEEAREITGVNEVQAPIEPPKEGPPKRKIWYKLIRRAGFYYVQKNNPESPCPKYVMPWSEIANTLNEYEIEVTKLRSLIRPPVAEKGMGALEALAQKLNWYEAEADRLLAELTEAISAQAEFGALYRLVLDDGGYHVERTEAGGETPPMCPKTVIAE